MKDSPCFGCEERHMRCHAECERYKVFKQGIEEDKQKISEYREKYCQYQQKIISGKTSAEYRAEKNKERKRRH